MENGLSVERVERAAEVLGAAAAGIGAGGSAMLLGLPIGWPVLPLGVASAAFGAAAGWALMRAVAPARIDHALPEFTPAPIEIEALVEPQSLSTDVQERALILDDPLPAPPADSRVVALFSAERPGELQQRIERHLAVGQGRDAAVAARDDADALHAALDEIRRSLRRS